MIAVDTSVWADFLRGRQGAHVDELAALLEADEPVCLTDIVLTELLQGAPTEREARRLERHLRAFDTLRLEAPDDFVFAAKLYRDARRRGQTIRRTLDCLIAAPCIRQDVALLHNDVDFDRLAAVSPLRIHRPRAEM